MLLFILADFYLLFHFPPTSPSNHLAWNGHCSGRGFSRGNQRAASVDFPVPHRLFFPSRLTSCAAAAFVVFLLHALIRSSPLLLLSADPLFLPRFLFSSSFFTVDRFRSRNFLSSSFSALPTLEFLSAGTGRNGLSSAARSTSSFRSDDDVPWRALTRESMSPTILRARSPNAVAFKSAPGYIQRVNYSVPGVPLITGADVRDPLINL